MELGNSTFFNTNSFSILIVSSSVRPDPLVTHAKYPLQVVLEMRQELMANLANLENSQDQNYHHFLGFPYGRLVLKSKWKYGINMDMIM
jgi:hypothetical protein